MGSWDSAIPPKKTNRTPDRITELQPYLLYEFAHLRRKYSGVDYHARTNSSIFIETIFPTLRTPFWDSPSLQRIEHGPNI